MGSFECYFSIVGLMRVDLKLWRNLNWQLVPLPVSEIHYAFRVFPSLVWFR